MDNEADPKATLPLEESKGTRGFGAGVRSLVSRRSTLAGVCLVVGYFAGHYAFRAVGEPRSISIGDLARSVKTQLQDMDSKRRERNEAPLFALKDFTLEMSFGVKTIDKHTGEVKIEVLTLGSQSEFSKEEIHKIQIHWESVQPTTFDIPPQAGSRLPRPTDKIQ